ncbi:MAG: aspartate carbamoyltransferase, partial [Clostridia bacterium]
PDCFMDGTADCMSLDEATKTADIIILLRVQFERHESSMGMTVNEYHEQYGMTVERTNRMKSGAIILHPAPINRGVEIANEVVECKQSRINNQMQNGVYTRMAVISMVLEDKL